MYVNESLSLSELYSYLIAYAPALAHYGTIILVSVLDMYVIVACTPHRVILASSFTNGNPLPSNDISYPPLVPPVLEFTSVMSRA